FSVEPFVVLDGKAHGWADVQASQQLLDGYLPVPSVQWRHEQFDLQVTGFVQGRPEQAQLVARYRLHNPDKVAHEYTLALAVRPFQVNPPSQFLNTVGGVSRIERLAMQDGQVSVNGQPRAFAVTRPDETFASTFDGKLEVTHLADKRLPGSHEVSDPTGLASGAML